MKYLILVIISLFCALAYSSHKDKDKTYPTDSYLYDKEKNPEEWRKQHEVRKIKEHFNEYMHFEMDLEFAIKGKHPYDLIAVFYSIQRLRHDYFYVDAMKLPDCSKKLLKEKKCPKAPYHAIYWAKKYLETGFLVIHASDTLSSLLEYYVIPKTDMDDNESFFNLLNYIAWYFNYKSNFYQAQLIDERLGKKPELFEKEKKACKEIKLCFDDKELAYEKIKTLKEQLNKVENRLNEKQKEIAEKMINDLIKKWSEKYGEENIYKKRKRPFLPSWYSDDIVEYFNKKYPHH